MASPANEFKQRLVGVRRILALDKCFDTPTLQVTRPSKRQLVTELRYACSILPVAYFDEFLRALMDEFAEKLSNYTPQVPWVSLPDKLRTAVVYESPAIMARGFRKRMVEADMLRIYEDLASPGVAGGRYRICKETIRETHSNRKSVV